MGLKLYNRRRTQVEVSASRVIDDDVETHTFFIPPRSVKSLPDGFELDDELPSQVKITNSAS